MTDKSSASPATGERSRLLLALDRMIESVQEEILENDPGNNATIGSFGGELKGLMAARTYAELDSARSETPRMTTVEFCGKPVAAPCAIEEQCQYGKSAQPTHIDAESFTPMPRTAEAESKWLNGEQNWVEFADGLERELHSARSAIPCSPWVLCTVRLPEGDQSVFATGLDATREGLRWRETVSAGWLRRNPNLVTHWMPLPEVPHV